MHEWGVWRDDGERMAPIESPGDDLPEFVHRSAILAEDIKAARFFTPMAVFKPVVFFYSQVPLSLLVRVGFHRGRPWAFFPKATDYVHHTARTGYAFRTERADSRGGGPPEERPADRAVGPAASTLLGAEDRNAGHSAPTLEDVPGILPPWLEGAKLVSSVGSARSFRNGVAPTASTERLRGFYETVPWVTPTHPMTPTMTGAGDLGIGSLGLEWCGLRVGYDPTLEGERPVALERSWWSFLREVPTSPVAVRGEAERFLFYDGVVDFPGPVFASWASDARDTLLLGARSFGEYPDFSTFDHWWIDEKIRDKLETTLPLPAVFVIRRSGDGDLRGTVLREVDPIDEPAVVRLNGLDLEGEELVDRFDEVLVAQGLTAQESRALVRTWRPEFFETSGLRVISVLPQWAYESLLPLELFPVPEELVRVGLIWRECDELEVGTDSWGRLTPEERWRAVPWKIRRAPLELEERPLELEEPLPVEVQDDGVVVLSHPKAGRPSLSADGSLLAFSTTEDSTGRVFILNLNERTMRQIVKVEGLPKRSDVSARLSSGGKHLVYHKQPPPNRSGNSFFVDLERETVVDLGTGYASDIDAEGKRILFLKPHEHRESIVTVLDLERREILTIFDLDRHGLLVSSDLSDDGSTVAFALEVDGNREVCAVDADEATLLNVSQSAGHDASPHLSENGERLIFESSRRRDPDILFADIPARRLVNLTSRAGSDRFCDITADGRRLIYRQADARGYFLVDLASGVRKKFDGLERSWSFDLSASGNRAAFLNWHGDDLRLIVRDLEWE